MSTPLTIKDLDREREKLRPAREKEMRERQLHPIPNERLPMCYFEAGRYIGGAQAGLYYLVQYLYADGKEIGHKILADGVDMHIIASEMRAALHGTLDQKLKI